MGIVLCMLAGIYSTSGFDEMMLLETELPDELMQGGSSAWDQNIVTNKPPAQGPGKISEIISIEIWSGNSVIIIKIISEKALA